MAFLGAGYTPSSREVVDGVCYGDVIKRAGEFLMKPHRETMYSRAIAALALCELHAASGNVRHLDAARRAVEALVAAQNPGLGWRYQSREGENDTSVTGWVVMALHGARLHGFDVPASVFDGARAWLDRVSYEAPDGTGRRWLHGYDVAESRKATIPGMNEHFDDHPTMSAVGSLCRTFIDRRRDDPKRRGGVDAVLDDLPRFDAQAADYYYWYYASLALFQETGGEGAAWERFEKAIDAALVPTQNLNKGRHAFGSWEPVDRWSGRGGRVYATALNALTLEVYYRYAGVFTGRDR